MSPIHCSPTEAVKIHKEIRAKKSIATHFGTFPLADDGEDEPIAALRQALVKEGIPNEQFIVLKEGEGRDF
jgi:L-ascorbate metabolism protein UlaG (beta-lactamase superfamily)